MIGHKPFNILRILNEHDQENVLQYLYTVLVVTPLALARV